MSSIEPTLSPQYTRQKTENESLGMDDLFGRGKAVEENAMRLTMQAASKPSAMPALTIDEDMLEAAFERCGEVTADYAKTFYLGTKLMTPEKQRAIWAVYVWCRRTDELVDGPNADRITPKALQRWEERLADIFNGKPYDTLDAALSCTIRDYPMSIQPFKDMIDGMRMDLLKKRYANFDELYEYCYRVAGTVALMSMPVMGLGLGQEQNQEKIYRAALSLGLANQLTNILRDVGEDCERGRIYVPQDDLRRFDISDDEVYTGCVDPATGKLAEKWKDFMKFQIKRARYYFKISEEGIAGLDKDARWPVWSALVVYRAILDKIEANDYDNFTRRAYVAKWGKIGMLPEAWMEANGPDLPTKS